MAAWLSGMLFVNGINVHYYRAGLPPAVDRPTLVLCHGNSDSARCWVRTVNALAGEYDIVLPDARGHGLSDGGCNGLQTELLAADLAGLLEQLGVANALLMGHSMGARTVGATAARYPKLARAVVAVDPPWDDRHRNGPRAVARGEERIREILERKGTPFPALVASGRRRHPAWTDEEVEAWAESKLQVDMDALRYPTQPYDWREDVAAIACPTLLVTGDPALGAIVSEQGAAEARRLNPRVQVAHIPQTGHSVHRDRFDEFLPAVQTFWRSI